VIHSDKIAMSSPHLLPVIAIFGLVAGPSGAQSNPPPSGAPGAAPAPPATSQTAAKSTDQTFVREASAAGLSEVAEAEAALKKAKRLDVRKAAQQLLTDHTAANEQLRALAQGKNMSLAATAAPKAATSTTTDFDAAYVASQINAHQDAIALFEAEAKTGSDNDLREFATSTLPTLRQHLSMMQSLQ
jgi:putative membrane protein